MGQQGDPLYPGRCCDFRQKCVERRGRNIYLCTMKPLKNGMRVLCQYAVINREALDASDHSPVYADVEI